MRTFCLVAVLPFICLSTVFAADKRPMDVFEQSGLHWYATPEGASAAASANRQQRPILWFRHVGEMDDGPMCSASHRMRMLSFADRDVQRELTPQFVLLSTNMEGTLGAGRSVGHLPKDEPGLCPPRLAHQNCQVYFLTPRLEMFHAATGFLSPADLAKEAQFAEDLFTAIQKRSKRAKETVVAAHRDFLKKQGFTDRDLAGSATPTQRLLANGTGLNLPLGGAPNVENLFGSIERGRILRDHQYLMEYPLISLADFERDPTPLVGHANFAFQSGEASGRNTGH
jgi:hypothetical protein